MQEDQAVETLLQGTGLDDAAGVLKESEGSSLDDVLGDSQEQQEDSTNEPAKQAPAKQEKQAGWIQKRIDEGVNKRLQAVLAEERAKMAAEYDAKLKPLQEAMLSREADELVASGEFKSKERALEYLHLKKGMPAAEQDQPPRNEKRQFTSQQAQSSPSPDTEQYGNMLIAQAKTIESLGGPNVMEAYARDPEIKRKVLAREWDFTDVAKYMAGQEEEAPLPTPSRRPNGSGPSSKAIKDLSDEEFKRVNEYLSRGGIIDMRQR